MGLAAWEDGRAEELGSHQRFHDAIARARIEQPVGLGLLGLGSALAVGGIVRLAVVARRSPRRTTAALSVAATPRALVVHGRFSLPYHRRRGR
jgi:hypothetical protein